MKSGSRLLLLGLALMILGECKDMVSEDFLIGKWKATTGYSVQGKLLV